MLIRPRLTDHYDLSLTQESADFAIPFLDEDLPLFVDPFLLWKSPALQDQALHTAMIASFNGLRDIARTDRPRAVDTLVRLSECEEIGLGAGRSRTGRRIGQDVAEGILGLFRDLPDIERAGIGHIEVLQLYIDQISKDRISDFTCGFLKSHLIDYTMVQAQLHQIPVQRTTLEVYSYTKQVFLREELELPVNPIDGKPILLVPKRWLRYAPWISFDDFFAKVVASDERLPRDRARILTYNRANHGVVAAYVAAKERQQADCANDPLFRPIPVTSAKKKLAAIRRLPTGNDARADKKYEDAAGALLASLFYPYLDFAAEQSRTESGVLIRDLIFYNGRSLDFLKDLYDLYACRQIVFELKNVRALEREHINQLNRYLKDEFGRVGVLVTRTPAQRSIQRNLVDLWSGQRRAIIVLTDTDLELMVEVFESKQRLPIEVLKRAYIDFTRAVPS
jgi:hypothetical protein